MAGDRREVIAAYTGRMGFTGVPPVLHHDLWEQPEGRHLSLREGLYAGLVGSVYVKEVP